VWSVGVAISTPKKPTGPTPSKPLTPASTQVKHVL
jgi:hypothetical protein